MATVTNVYAFKGMHPDDMKKSYKRLAMKLRPDVSGYDSTNDMKVLNGEFSYWYAIAARDGVFASKVAEKPESRDYYERTYHSTTYVNDLAAAINELLNHGIYTCGAYDVELVGTFIWIFNVAASEKNVHTDLKGMGFQFKYKFDEDSGKKIPAWFYTPNYRPINTRTSRQDMERRYGAQKIYGHKGLPGSAD